MEEEEDDDDDDGDDNDDDIDDVPFTILLPVVGFSVLAICPIQDEALHTHCSEISRAEMQARSPLRTIGGNEAPREKSPDVCFSLYNSLCTAFALGFECLSSLDSAAVDEVGDHVSEFPQAMAKQSGVIP